MNKECEEKLELEREKLNQLIDEAIRNGTPICKTTEIMKQSRKVNQLILKKNTANE